MSSVILALFVEKSFQNLQFVIPRHAACERAKHDTNRLLNVNGMFGKLLGRKNAGGFKSLRVVEKHDRL